MKIRILKSAKNDLKEGYFFYEFQKSGLGTYLLTTLFSDIESLKISAGVHSIQFEKYFRLLSKRFPFAVYYQLKDDHVNIHAVVDCRRNPAWIKNVMLK
jgi:hypothetical protein